MTMDDLVKKAQSIEDPEIKAKEEELFNHIKNTKNPVLKMKYLKMWRQFVENL